jgi:uncharacterized protein
MTLEQVVRYDTFKIPKVKKTKEGYLRGDAVGSRSGVFIYHNHDGSVRRELRHPDDIFKKESLDTLKMIPVTLDHPNEFVNSGNVTSLQKGYTGENIQVLDEKIITSLTITSQDAIDDILKGKCVELSYGYEVTLVKEDGVYNGEKYDYRQTNPVYNHLALVAQGRAGHDARVRFDGQDAKEVFECRFDDLNKLTNIKEVNMSDNKTEHKVENNDAAEVLKIRFDAALVEKELIKNKLTQSELKVDALEKSLTKLNEDLANEKKKSAPEIRAKETMDRVEMLARSAPYIDIEAYIHHADRDIMIAAINADRTDSINFSERSDEYVKGMFETLIGASYKADKIDTAAVFGVLSQKCDTSRIKSPSNDLFKQLDARYNKGK